MSILQARMVSFCAKKCTSRNSQTFHRKSSLIFPSTLGRGPMFSRWINSPKKVCWRLRGGSLAKLWKNWDPKYNSHDVDGDYRSWWWWWWWSWNGKPNSKDLKSETVSFLAQIFLRDLPQILWFKRKTGNMCFKATLLFWRFILAGPMFGEFCGWEQPVRMLVQQ